LASQVKNTGRSRNDQVATDIRLYRDEIDILGLLQLTKRFTAALAKYKYYHAWLYSFTNSSTCDFGHHLLAWFEMLVRERTFKTAVNVLIVCHGSAA
jgi:argininosuccinate lyase